jgi:hypothetical protein
MTMAFSCAVELGDLFVLLSWQFGEAPEPLPEEELLGVVALARDGDRAAGSRLYQQLAQGLPHGAPDVRQRGGRRDATQDALLAVLTSLDRYRP